MTSSTNSTISYILGSDSVTVYVSSKPYCINKQAHNYDLVIKAIQSGDITKVEAAVNTKQTIINKLKDKSGVRIEGNQIFFGDRLIEGLISSRIFEMITLGLDVQPMVNFLDNMLQNPSKRAVDELFGFMEACTLPITPDGHFLAYKRVRDNYKDVHSGTMDNSVGNILEMPRNEVDDNKDQECSYGLHACSYSYLSHFPGARIVVVKINPQDVVSIPVGYESSKLRTCRYEVVDEIELNEQKLPSTQIDTKYATKHDSNLLQTRNQEIINDNLRGKTVKQLCNTFSLSPRQIRRILNGAK